MTTAQAKKILAIDTENINLSHLDIDELKDIDFDTSDIMSYLQDNNELDVEIIYYRRAMEYLMEHDTSLKESLGIAHEYGYTPDNLSSEILASLLASQNAYEEVREALDEIV